MPPPENKNKKTKKRVIWKIFWRTIVLLVLLSYVYKWTGEAKLDAAIAEARRQGFPLTYEEIEAARKTWPEGQNGAEVYLRLVDRLDAINKAESRDPLPVVGTGDLPELGYRWDNQTDELVAAFLEQNTDVLREIDQIRNYSGGSLPFDRKEDPLDMLIHDYSLFRLAAKCKSLQVTYRIMHQESDRLIDDVKAILAYARLLEEQPDLISALVYIAINSLTVSTLQDTLGQVTLEPHVLEEIDHLLESVPETGRMHWGMIGERVCLMLTYDEPYKKYENRHGRWIAYLPLYWVVQGWRTRDKAIGLSLCNKCIELSRVSPQTVKHIDEIKAQIEAVPKYYIMTCVWTSGYGRAFILDLITTAKIRSARVALAAERYRLDRGAFPDQLDQLVPAYMDKTLLDPFDNLPLRYRRDEDRVVIYSIGENRIDDGGATIHECGKKNDMPDVGFILLEPSARGRLPRETSTSTATSPGK